jgi:hypothetical protein
VGGCFDPDPLCDPFDRFVDDLVCPFCSPNARGSTVWNHVVVGLTSYFAGLNRRAQDREQFEGHGQRLNLSTLLVDAHRALFEIDIAPAKTACSVTPRAGAGEDRKTEELLLVLRRREHQLDLRGSDDHDLCFSGLRATWALNPLHRVGRNLTFKVKPSEQSVQGAMDRADRRRGLSYPVIEERPTVVGRNLSRVDVRARAL